ncbi:FAD binding domain-containing protein, partial [bacterium]|nr:FAD binding domain-containing protein [bacterium]
DLMVDININRNFPENIIDISEIDDLSAIRIKQDSISIGSGVTLTSIIEHPGIREKLPILRETLLLVGSEQIRNMATLAGNIANASPIADGVVALLGLDADVTLLSKNGRRNVKLSDFFIDYKQTDLQTGEILGEIHIPIQEGFFNFEKSSKRQAVDIATVNSFCYLKEDSGLISDCRFVFGGMDKTVRLAESCRPVVQGKKLDDRLILKCAEAAVKEFEPISDVRGSADYRRQLVENHIVKHLHKFLSINE